MGASSETLEFNANASKALAEIAKLVAAEKELAKEMRKTATEAVKGSAEASNKLEQQAKKTLELKNAQDATAKSLREMSEAAKRAGQGGGGGLPAFDKNLKSVGVSAGQANANIAQLSFAADDFMTVLQMNNYSMNGWIAGLRSAGNNLSFVLASINPLYAIIPSVGTALAGFLIPRLFGSADASKAAAESGKEYTRILVEQREALLGVSEGEKAAQEAKDERVYQEQLAKVTEETGFREKERAFRSAQDRLVRAKKIYDATPEPFKPLAAEELEQSLIGVGETVQEFSAAKDTVQKFVDDRRRFVEARNARKAEDQQQANFKRANAGAIRGAEGKYGTFSGDIKRRAEVGFAQGLSEEQVIANLAPVMAAGLNEGEQEAIAPKFLEDIAAAKQDAALKPGKSAEEVKAAGLRQQLRQISAERAAAVAAAPRNRLSGAQDRGFREQEAPVQAELAAVEAKMQADKGELTDGLKTMVDRLDTLIKVVAGRNAGRPLARDGGQ